MPWPRGFDAVDFDWRSSRNGWNRPHGVGAAADAGDERIGQPAFGGLHLLARLAADDRLEIAHHGRIRMRAGDRADAIERVGDVGDPIAQRLFIASLSVLEPRLDGANLGAEHFHPPAFGFCRSTSTAPM